MDLISIVIGAGSILIIFGITELISKLINKNRGHSLNEMKTLVSNAHIDVYRANENLRKLQKVLLEVEGQLNDK